MYHRAAFCSLNDVAKQLMENGQAFGATATEQAIIDSWKSVQKAFFKELILDVSDKIATLWGYSFVPFNRAYTIYAQDSEWCGWAYDETGLRYYFSELPYADGLAISAVTLDGASLAASNYRLSPNNAYPAWALAFNSDSVTVPFATSFDTSLVITGTWGYHESPTTMWKSIGTLASGINDSVTSITDATLDNLAEIYGYWQIDSEVLFITDVNTTTNVITIERGALGTTAAAHLAGATVKKFMPMPQVVLAMRRLCVLLDNKKAETGDITVIGDTTIQVAGESIKLDIARKHIYRAV